MALPPLVLRVVADTKGVQTGIAKTNGTLAKFKTAASTAGKVASVALAGVAVASVKFAIEAQEAQLKLANSIKNSAVVAKSSQAAFNAQAEAIRRLTGADDEAIAGAQAFLVQMGLTEDQVLRLTPRIVDLSSKLGIDLETASKAVGKAVNGNIGGLSRLGIVVDKTAASSDAFGATLKALGGAAGFAAQKARAQPWLKIKSDLEELAESIGATLLPIVRQVIGTVQRWVQKFNDLSPATRKTIVRVGLLVAALYPVLKVVNLIRGALGGLATAFGLGGGAAAAFALALGTVVAAGVKLHGYFKMDDQQAKKWADSIKNGAATLDGYREAVQKVTGEEGLSDIWNGDRQTLSAYNQTVKIATQTFYKYVGAVLEGEGVSKKWREALRDSGAMSIRQKESLAALFVATERYNVALSDSQQAALEAFIATGDYRSALHLLRSALGGVLGPLKNLLTYTQRQGEAAADAAQKNQRYVFWLKQIKAAGGGASVTVPNAGGSGGSASGQLRALGGPVSAGRAYIVGERGPEWFVPKASGDIIPNADGGTPVVNVYVGEEKVEDIVVRALNRAVAKA